MKSIQSKISTLIFATSNANKVKEVHTYLSGQYEIKSLKDISYFEDIPETSPTIEGNAIQKAQFVFDKLGYNCFSEDTGFEVEGLNGAPGVYSARYAGPERDANANMDKVLNGLKNKENRNARFKTVIALIIEGEVTCFEGICNGKVTLSKKGTKGFGYDPIFIPNDYDVTFAQMSIEEKSKISHRGKAMKKFVEFLSK